MNHFQHLLIQYQRYFATFITQREYEKIVFQFVFHLVDKTVQLDNRVLTLRPPVATRR